MKLLLIMNLWVRGDSLEFGMVSWVAFSFGNFICFLYIYLRGSAHNRKSYLSAGQSYMSTSLPTYAPKWASFL